MSLDSSAADKRKSFLIATLIYGVLLLILFFIRFWPPSDAELAQLTGGGGGGGVTINFGDSDVGSGADFKSEVLDVKNDAKSKPAESTPEEDILAQDNNDATDVAIPKHDTPKNIKPVVKKTPEPVVVKKKADNSATSALNDLIHGKSKGGDGDDNEAGNKGKSNGKLNSKGYYGDGGEGGGEGGGKGTGKGKGKGPGEGDGEGGGKGNGKGPGAGYFLGGRKPIESPKPNYNCGNESGLVIVRVFVDKNGNVISAIPGVKGTKNPNSCLLAEAKKAALKTKWEPSPDGTEKQEGTIGYNFTIRN